MWPDTSVFARAWGYWLEEMASAADSNVIGAQVGYRSFDVEAQIDQDSGTLTMKGVYFGIVARY